MIVADTSALVAVVFGEPDYAAFAEVLDQEEVAVSGATLTEAGIVVESRHGPEGTRELELLISQVVAHVLPIDAAHARAAVAAWRRFGRGRHPAGLNLGDCFSYATASLAGAALLFKGSDFSQTDVVSALKTR